MPPSSISFFTDCPICNRKVTAMPLLGRADLVSALEGDADVRLVHFPDQGQGDHQWSLTKEQKANLSKQIANGLV
jgi:hypothetical protein